MADLENVMHRLSAQTERLRTKTSNLQSGEQALMVESLVLVSEALLKVGRDVRYIRNELAEKH